MSAPTALTVIRPPDRSGALDLQELLAYRDVVLGRVGNNLKVQYGEAHLGYAWVVAQPLLVVAVFAWLRGASAARTNVTMPYTLWVLSGLLLWYYFVDATTAVAGSARRDASLLKKVYFPRLLSPAVPLLEHLFALGVGFLPLALMMSWYGVRPGWRLALLPLVMLQVMGLVLGLGCLWASWTLGGADVEKVLRHAFYLGLFVSPVLYAPGGSWLRDSAWLFANPMSGSLIAFRACLFRDVPFPAVPWAWSCAFTLAVLWIGVRAFRRAEADFLDTL